MTRRKDAPSIKGNGMGKAHPDHTVLVLDDDRSVLVGLERLLIGNGYHVRTFSEAGDFFNAGPPKGPACLILDNQLNHGMTGTEVHCEMIRRGWDIPTVFLTAHWNVQSIVKAMRAGADGFLTKPFDPSELVEAVAVALDHSRAKRVDSVPQTEARARAAALTAREREIVRLVVTGMLNKEIADQLSLALVTVKVHRGRAMHKLGAGNAAELALIAAQAGIVNA